MLNFETAKARIAEIAGVEATAVTIGFTRRAYEITIEGAELTRKMIAEIVTVLGEAVVKTIAYVSADKNSVIVIFDMN